MRWGLNQNVAFWMDKWFILKNQNWILSTCDSFPLIMSHIGPPRNDWHNLRWEFVVSYLFHLCIEAYCILHWINRWVSAISWYAPFWRFFFFWKIEMAYRPFCMFHQKFVPQKLILFIELKKTKGMCAQLHFNFYRFIKNVVCAMSALVVWTILGKLKVWNVKSFCMFSSKFIPPIKLFMKLKRIKGVREQLHMNLCRFAKNVVYNFGSPVKWQKCACNYVALTRWIVSLLLSFNPNTFTKKEERREDGEKKHAQRARMGWAQTRDLPCARRVPPAAHHRSV